MFEMYVILGRITEDFSFILIFFMCFSLHPVSSPPEAKGSKGREREALIH